VNATEPLRRKRAASAGGVVFRHGADGVEIVLCGRSLEELWALPKGTPNPGESLRETAEREVREETGLGVNAVADLGAIEYSFARPAEGVQYDKTVTHYLMQPDGTGAFEEHDHEYDRVAWFPAAEALRKMTHANERRVVERALDVIARDGDAA
jgi:ADP-ribose pyrophosphatase YjhB (NUDIX family)